MSTLNSMRSYIRSRQKGGRYFFTVNLAIRHDNPLLIEHIDDLRSTFKQVQQAHPFTLDAIVVLPEHLHCLWQLPAEDDNYSMRWRLIKSCFSRRITNTESLSKSRMRKGERGIWQRRYWEHAIRNDQDFKNHLDYIHFNPVKHGYVRSVKDWPHSSFFRWVKKDVYTVDWAGSSEAVGIDWE